MSEHTLMRLIEARLNVISGVRVWRSNSGAARTADGGFVRFGMPGQADLTGIMGPGGRRLEVEVKAPGSKRGPTAAQAAFGATISALGGLYVVARSLDEATQPVLDALEVSQ